MNTRSTPSAAAVAGLSTRRLDDDGRDETGALQSALAAGRKSYYAFCRGGGGLLRSLGDGSVSAYATPDGSSWPVTRLDTAGSWVDARGAHHQVVQPHDAEG